jgi:transmembrane sensor
MNASTGSSPQRFGSTAAAEAGAWDARLRAPDCNDDDRTRFAAWRDTDPTHQAAFEHLQTLVASLRGGRGRADARALRDEALRAVRARGRRKRAWGTVAASVVAVGICVAFWNMSSVDWLQTSLDDLIAPLTGTKSYATGTGQRSTFVLEDGSSVELNAESRIKVTFSETRRNVQLTQGQGLFSVAKNPQRPFIVHARNRDIVAVGTQFDVRLDSRSLQVTLIEGKVRVQQSRTGDPQSPGSLGSPADTAEVYLTPGKQLIAKPLASTVRDIDVARVTGWRDGRIFLEDLSLADAVAEMNKYSATQIKVIDPALAGLRVNGMFMAGGQEAFASALESYFPIAAERHGDKTILLMTRH